MTDERQAGLREALAAEVAEWRQDQRRTTGEKDADEGYAAGLGRAIFAVEELLAVPAQEEGPSRSAPVVREMENLVGPASNELVKEWAGRLASEEPLNSGQVADALWNAF